MKYSYETDFWIIDHEWYVNIQVNYPDIDVYTIQYPFTTFKIFENEYGKIIMTIPHDYQPVFNNIKTLDLIVESDLNHYFPQQRYSNVQSLRILTVVLSIYIHFSNNVLHLIISFN